MLMIINIFRLYISDTGLFAKSKHEHH